jgi:hypothetical protein
VIRHSGPCGVVGCCRLANFGDRRLSSMSIHLSVQLGIICGKSSYDLVPAKALSPDFLYPLVRGHPSREGDTPTTRGRPRYVNNRDFFELDQVLWGTKSSLNFTSSQFSTSKDPEMNQMQEDSFATSAFTMGSDDAVRYSQRQPLT